MRSYHETIANLITARADAKVAREALPGDWWKAPTDDQQHAFDRYTTLDGMVWAFSASRLSFAAEDVLKSVDDLEALAARVIAKIHADRDTMTMGSVAAALNNEGRIRIAALTS